ncbi:hypothetical protein E3N88_16571 [Mikania micrantha]|uniref:Leucine-rich repeat-containing N-terminal plant-type domain-containing protein n=1 Tax=Mikania micrantha TaxID=192012 RepID=A0A5N6P0G6_9ASTR|nr:hypothetical protein E3N88_16571 [Mikania micrantha]
MSIMRNNMISNRLLYVVLFISLLLVVYFTCTTAFYLPGVGKCIDNERHALLDFKASIDHDPNGFLSAWNTREEATSDCCEWFRVTCSNQTGHIISLDLSFGYLQVENLDWLSHMSKLEELRMNDVFMGKADNWIWDIDVSNNSLQEVDSEAYMSKVTMIDMSSNNIYGYNKLFGKIPSSVQLLKNLKELYLNNNNFSGQLPLSLGSCTELILIDLGANGFSGSVPFWIGEKLSSLYAFILTSNNFSGTIPSQLCQLANLQLLDLSKNNLHGTIPPCLGNLTAMVQEGYAGNAELCGLPVSKYCPGDKELQLPPILGENNGDDDKENIWFYIGGAIGFAIGFWTVCIVLLVYNIGRHAFFHFMNTLESWIFVKVMVFISKLQRITCR